MRRTIPRAKKEGSGGAGGEDRPERVLIYFARRARTRGGANLGE